MNAIRDILIVGQIPLGNISLTKAPIYDRTSAFFRIFWFFAAYLAKMRHFSMTDSSTVVI